MQPQEQQARVNPALDRASLLQLSQVSQNVDEVVLPGGHRVFVRGLSASEWNRFEKLLSGSRIHMQQTGKGTKGKRDFTIGNDQGLATQYAVAAGTLKPNKDPMFNPNDPSDLEAVAQMRRDVIALLAEKILLLSGVEEEEEEPEGEEALPLPD